MIAKIPSPELNAVGSRIALDPRTVSRTILLERAGVSRPAISVIVMGSSLNPKRAPSSLLAEEPKPQAIATRNITTQVIIADDPGSESAMVQASGERAAAFVNRAAHRAIGKVLLLLFGSEPVARAKVAEISTQFEKSAQLGATILTAPAFIEGVAVRSEVWIALDGLETSYASLSWAFKDLFTRIRSIGYRATHVLHWHQENKTPAAGKRDESLYRRRRALAPDRSRQRPQQPYVPDRAGNIAVYTAISNGYDTLKPQPSQFLSGSKIVAFLDGPTALQHGRRTRGWQIEESSFAVAEPRRGSRFFKANSHLALPNATISLWVDASISIVAPMSLARLAELFLTDADVCVFRHHARRSIAQEAQACKLLGLDHAEVIDAQLERYRAEGMPRATGLAELPVLLSRHTPQVCALNEAWWAEILTGSHRDQLSFNYVVWKFGINYATFPLFVTIPNGLFRKFQRTAQGPLEHSQGRSDPQEGDNDKQ